MHPLIVLGLRCPEHSNSRRLAEGTLLSGDAAGIGMLWDSLQEEDVEMLELRIGEAYLIRTLTYYYTGRVKSVSLTTVVLEEAACIYDSGRWSEALRTGKLNEVEPFPDEVLVSAPMIVDAVRWRHKLPRDTQ